MPRLSESPENRSTATPESIRREYRARIEYLRRYEPDGPLLSLVVGLLRPICDAVAWVHKRQDRY